MAYRKTTTVQQAIPLRYRCSECDAEALGILLAEGEGSTIIQSRIMDEYDYRTQNSLYRKAFKVLKRRIHRIYKKEPEHWYRIIKCECANCKNVEPWGNDPNKKLFNWGTFFLPLSVAFVILSATLLTKLGWISVLPYILVGEIVALIAGKLIWGAFSPRKCKIRKYVSTVATEKRPKYEKTEKEILEIVDNNLKSRIVDEGDGLSLKDFAGVFGQSNEWNR